MKERFSGTHLNRLDAKGRISVPAAFRTVLRNGLAEGEAMSIWLRPSHKHACLEAWPPETWDRMISTLDGIAPFSDEWEDRLTVIYGEASQVELDKEGRIALPETLAARANLAGQVAFMGLGEIFQIWEPAALERRQDHARTNARLRDSRPAGLA